MSGFLLHAGGHPGASADPDAAIDPGLFFFFSH
jgi:hypothetical protein